MSLKTRVKKLETKVLPAVAAAACVCVQANLNAVAEVVYLGAADKYPELPEGRFCETCGKAVSPRDIDMLGRMAKAYGGADE